MSGAFPITTASMFDQLMPGSSRGRLAASRTRPALETSCRFDAYFVWPTPTTATRVFIGAPGELWSAAEQLVGEFSCRFTFEDGNQVLLQARPAGRGSAGAPRLPRRARCRRRS